MRKGKPTKAGVSKGPTLPVGVFFIDRLCFLILVFRFHSKFTDAVTVPLKINK